MTVSPKRQYLGIVRPTTPATVGPKMTQKRKINRSHGMLTEHDRGKGLWQVSVSTFHLWKKKKRHRRRIVKQNGVRIL